MIVLMIHRGRGAHQGDCVVASGSISETGCRWLLLLTDCAPGGQRGRLGRGGYAGALRVGHTPAVMGCQVGGWVPVTSWVAVQARRLLLQWGRLRAQTQAIARQQVLSLQAA